MVLHNMHQNYGGPESPGAIKLDTKKYKQKKNILKNKQYSL